MEENKESLIIRLIVRHPCIDPQQIEKILGASDLYHKSGDIRKTPKGRSIGGVWTETLCSYAFDISNLTAQNDDPSQTNLIVNNVVENVEKIGRFFEERNDDQYSLEISIDFDGSANQSIHLSHENIEKVARYNLSLGVEIF